MALNPKYPTIEHERTSEAILYFFLGFPVVNEGLKKNGLQRLNL